MTPYLAGVILAFSVFGVSLFWVWLHVNQPSKPSSKPARAPLRAVNPAEARVR